MTVKGIDGPLSGENSGVIPGSGVLVGSQSNDPLVTSSVENLPLTVVHISSPNLSNAHRVQTTENESSEIDNDDGGSCGWGPIKPVFLQRFRTPKWVLFCLCWAGAIQGLIVNGFINVVITSIERRYELKSTESGLIAGSYDIASFLCLVPVSYFGGSKSKPFFIGTGFLLLATGSLVFSLPYFAAGPYSFSLEQEWVCSHNNTQVCDQTTSTLSNYKYLFIFGQLLHGAGASPLYTLGCTYLDEIVPTKLSSMYLGIFYTMAIIGPAIGYLLGGQLLRIYVDAGVDPKQFGLSQSSNVWVGAWWIGFLGVAGLGYLISVPLLSFPKSLPGSKKIKAEKVSETHKKLQDSDASRLGFGTKLQDMPSSFKLLITNPTFVFISLAGASDSILISGMATFLPKIIESQFSIAASTAALLVGAVTIPGAGGGNFLGGYLVKRFNLKCASIIRMCVAFCLCSLGLSFFFLLYCPNLRFAGLNEPIRDGANMTFIDECNRECDCSTDKYDPICGTNNVMYYSPCLAGCESGYAYKDSKVYSKCRCIKDLGRNVTINGTEIHILGTRDKCTTECEFVPVLITGMMFFAMFFTFLVSMPSLAATLRCVADSQRSFALGVQWIAVRLLGTIPSPILFGLIIDFSCKLWQESCNKKGSCLFYDNKRLNTNMLVIMSIVKSVTALFFFLAWFLYKPPNNKSKETKCDNVPARNAVGEENQGAEIDSPRNGVILKRCSPLPSENDSERTGTHEPDKNNSVFILSGAVLT